MLPAYGLSAQHVVVLLGISQQCECSGQKHSPCQFRSVKFGTSQLRDPKFLLGCVMLKDHMLFMYALGAQRFVVLLGIL